MKVSGASSGFTQQHSGLQASVRSRDARAAQQFFRKALKANQTREPRVINVDIAFPSLVKYSNSSE